jgi:hypothetical protein
VGLDNEIIPMFKLQKEGDPVVCGAGTCTSCRQPFKDCKILWSLHYIYLKYYVF